MHACVHICRSIYLYLYDWMCTYTLELYIIASAGFQFQCLTQICTPAIMQGHWRKSWRRRNAKLIMLLLRAPENLSLVTCGLHQRLNAKILNMCACTDVQSRESMHINTSWLHAGNMAWDLAWGHTVRWPLDTVYLSSCYASVKI